MKTVVRVLAGVALAAVVTGGAVVGLGLYNVTARTGHLPGVGWLFHTAYKQSVRLRAPSKQAIPRTLGDADRIALGALHFQSACAFCHATPDQPRSATALSMTPAPPHITDAVADWTPEHLFWIVDQGIKMSGMPHWPATNRADEVWSVVAYLDAVRDMEGTDHAALTGGALPRPDCTACHGDGGRSKNGYIPRLDILTPAQISAALVQYRDGTRQSGFMWQAARQLTDASISALADEFGTTGLGDPALPDDPTPAQLLATRGTEDVPACTACHGPARASQHQIAPSLAGQSGDYLEVQLRLWRAGHRKWGPRSHVMEKAAKDLSDADIAALTNWFAALPDGIAR